MSGGTWDYKDSDSSNYRIESLPEVVNFLIRVFHEIDWAESGDKTRKEVEPIIYNFMLDLGYRLFGEY